MYLHKSNIKTLALFVNPMWHIYVRLYIGKALDTEKQD